MDVGGLLLLSSLCRVAGLRCAGFLHRPARTHPPPRPLAGRSYANQVAVGEGIRASGIAREEIHVTTKVCKLRVVLGDAERDPYASE